MAIQINEDWHTLERTSVVAMLESDCCVGLRHDQVTERQKLFGKNELIQQKTRSVFHILREQFSSTIVLLLVSSALISLLLKDLKDALAITAILVLNSSLGFIQEFRAEQAVASLRKLAVPSIRVRRNGSLCEIPATDLVVGDIIILDTGVIVPADCRIVESNSLQVQESLLTGESIPVEKSIEELSAKMLALGDRRNMVYMGTDITYGSGLAIVTSIGMATELGKIASLLQSIKRESTPLQQRLNQFGGKLFYIACGIIAIIFSIELSRGSEIRLALLTSISIAVAAVPEGLPAVVTIALALGAQRMLKQKALIRKLPAVETLGSVTVICSDKTGTLTQNKMSLNSIFFDLDSHQISEEKILSDTGSLLLSFGSLSTNALIIKGNEPEQDQITGDPTEVALITAASNFELYKSDLVRLFPRVHEIPFSSERKLMTTVHQIECKELDARYLKIIDESILKNCVAITKGAVDKILDICDFHYMGKKNEIITTETKRLILAAQDNYAQRGMRVLGIAYRYLENLEQNPQNFEANMTFLGLVAMIDPPRSEAKDAVFTCREAGIRPIMITGDHPITALSIAKSVGIVEETSSTTDTDVITGSQLDNLTKVQLRKIVQNVSVFARVSPEHKLKIIEVLQEYGNIVAMTGDGVNDAPALRRADIGVAMGKEGTDVAKESSDMVLLDDNFATIVTAVREGRVIFENIRKFIKYLMTTNYAEIFVMLISPLLGMPLPLLPLQILWLNLLTDGPPALALGFESAESNIMKHPPHNPKSNIFAGGIGAHIVWVGSVMGIVSIGIGFWYWSHGARHWQTMIFLTLTLCQLAHVLAIRSVTSLFSGKDSSTSSIFANKSMLIAIITVFTLQILVIYTPLLQHIFSTEHIPIFDFIISLIGALIIFILVEVEEFIANRKVRYGSIFQD